MTNIRNALNRSVGTAFGGAAQWTSQQCGRPTTFIAACTLIVVWAGTGPIFDYSDTWQLIINTGTTIVTFLMVFLIQNTQNRDMAILHLKLDELIRANQSARNRMIDLESMTEEELDRMKAVFARIANVTPEAGVLRDAAEDLEAASGEIREAQEKVAAVADRSQIGAPAR